MQQQITAAAHPPPPTLQCIQLAAPTFNAAVLQNGVGQEGWWCTSFPDKGRDPAFDLHGSPPYSSCSTTITSAAVYSCPKSCKKCPCITFEHIEFTLYSWNSLHSSERAFVWISLQVVRWQGGSSYRTLIGHSLKVTQRLQRGLSLSNPYFFPAQDITL